MFRNVVEAVTYAMFPLFVLLLLLTSGRETMLAFRATPAWIWIQLWPRSTPSSTTWPRSTRPAIWRLRRTSVPGTKALALQTASTIYSRAISGEAVVGYLAISIPSSPGRP